MCCIHSTASFKANFDELLKHDKQVFDAPAHWRNKEISQSPLLAGFPALWNSLRDVYLLELPKLAFVPVPAENDVAKAFTQIVEKLTFKE